MQNLTLKILIIKKNILPLLIQKLKQNKTMNCKVVSNHKVGNITYIYYSYNGQVFEASVGALKPFLADLIEMGDVNFTMSVQEGYYEGHPDSPYADFVTTEKNTVGKEFEDLPTEKVEYIIGLAHDEDCAEALFEADYLVESWETATNGNFFVSKTVENSYGISTVAKHELFIFHKYDMPKDTGRWHCIEFRGNGEASFKEIVNLESVQVAYKIGDLVPLQEFVNFADKQGVISQIMFSAMVQEFVIADRNNLLYSKKCLTNGKY